MDNKNVKKKLGLIKIIVIAALFGLLGGIGGEIISKSYVSDYIYTPYLSEINLSGNNNGSNLVIRDAKKIVIEQNEKAVETVKSGSGSIVGIFKKKNPPRDLKFNLNNFYQKDEELGEGFILTSDGWIAADFAFAQKDGQADIGGYAVLAKDGKIYAIDKVVKDKLSDFYFIHIQASDLPVKEFAGKSDLTGGQLLLAVNWDGKSWLSAISSLNEKSDETVFSADAPADELVLAGKPSDAFNGSILFGLENKIAGFIDTKGNIIPISHFFSAINSLLKNKKISRPYLGVNYINLSLFISAAPNANDAYKKGALIYKNKQGIAVAKNSPAEKAGLKEGDVILSVNNIEINQDNSLAGLLQQFIAGDKIKIAYMRGTEKKEAEVVLGESK